jgi:hypothetical protein
MSHHHRTTMAKILQHPVSHNIEWNDVLSLMNAVGDVEEKHDGKFTFIVNSESLTLERPSHKDLDTQAVIDLRKLLASVSVDLNSDDENHDHD